MDGRLSTLNTTLSPESIFIDVMCQRFNGKKTNVVLDKEVNGNKDVQGEGQMEK